MERLQDCTVSGTRGRQLSGGFNGCMGPTPSPRPPLRRRTTALEEKEEQVHSRHRNHGDDRAGRPAICASEAGRALAHEGQAIYAEIGRTFEIIDVTGGATDAGFAKRGGKAIVVESFGLAGFGYHAHDEYIDTSSIVPRLYLMTRMLMELAKKK